MKRNVYLAQVNNRYGRSAFLPYSVGLLHAYAQGDEEIRSSYRFPEILWWREPPDTVVSRMREWPPDVLGVSCYIWNWEYSKALSSAVKREYPGCLVVAGGPHVPEDVPVGFFQYHPFFDILVHHEGELSFALILKGRLADDAIPQVPGTTFPNRDGTARSIPSASRTQLERIPSPYLTGVFDELITKPNVDWDASQETHRGCPYACTFCDWGSAVFTKVRRFPEDRIYTEYEWMAAHGIGLLYNCDANYGLFPRDVELTQQLAALKQQHGFPQQFRAAYAKNSNKRVVQIGKILNDAGMCKGVTLSFQSLDPHTLRLIKRKNMDINDFSGLVATYKAAGIPTYTELILPLPGETYDSFCDGVDTLLDAGQHDALNIYPCMILPNSEMSQPGHRELHGIQSVVVPDLGDHTVPANDPYQETKGLVVATATMPLEDWRRAYVFGLIVQGFHSMGLTQYAAITVRAFAVTYRQFYERPIIQIPDAARRAGESADRLAGGEPVTEVLPLFGSTTWTPEESLFLTCIQDDSQRAELRLELKKLLVDLLRNCTSDPEGLARDVMVFQDAIVANPQSPRRQTVSLRYDLPTFFASNDVEYLLHERPGKFEFSHPSAYGGDYERYAREVVWYGRKASRWRAGVARL